MKSRKNIFVRWILIFSIVIPLPGLCQQSLEIPLGDRLELSADEYRGEISWQQSFDLSNWENIENSSSANLSVDIQQTPVYFRARIIEENCDPHFSEIITVDEEVPLEGFLWSQPSTWETGVIPQAGEDVIIPEGQRVILDINTPDLNGLTINGVLEFNNQDLELTANWILINGKLQIGVQDSPFTNKAIITLNDTDPENSIMDMGTRGIIVMGELSLHGETPDILWTKLDQHSELGSTNIQLVESPGWGIGQEIVIGPTDFYESGQGTSVTQKLTINSIENNNLGFSQGLNAHRWGLLQYATQDGMSLENSNLISPPIADTESTSTPLILDERAPVGLLSRNIVIQAPDDEAWQNLGFGAHIMIMHGGSVQVDGVEIRRGGQRGRIRRYPFHWHMLSYEGSQTLSDAAGQYIVNSSINESRNRGIVIHGTNGVVVQNNVVFDIEGHGIFTEDAVERRNTIDNNLVLKIRNPPNGTALKVHEANNFDKGSSGFWLSNPDNVVTNNHVGDCIGFGYWLAYPAQPWGLSSSVLGDNGLLMQPNRIRFGVFDNNTTHSNRKDGIMLDFVEIDNEGNTREAQYASTSDGNELAFPYDNLERFALSRYKTWKNGDNGIWDRGVWPDNYEVVSADNCGRFFAGSGASGVIERSLVVGTSLNHIMNGTGRPVEADFFGAIQTSTPVAFATYHSTFDIKNNIVINFPVAENERSGAFASEDYYVRPVDKGHQRNTGNLLIDAHPGVKLPAFADYFSLSGALWDPNGMWGPTENYFVYDTPFFTHGQTVTVVEPASGAGGVSVPGPFYGFKDFVLFGIGDTYPQNQPFRDLWGIHVRRLDQDLNEVGTWTVRQADFGWPFDHMKDFAAHREGIYELSFPEESNKPTDIHITVENMLEDSDQLVLGVSFDSSVNPTVGLSIYGRWNGYQSVSSLESVINSDGETWWHDKESEIVWVKLKGGRWQFWTDDPNQASPTSDELLYEPSTLRILPAE